MFRPQGTFPRFSTAALWCPGLLSRSSNSNAYRGRQVTLDKGHRLDGGGGVLLSFSMVIAFLEFKTPKPVLLHLQPHCLPSGSEDRLNLFQGHCAGQCRWARQNTSEGWMWSMRCQSATSPTGQIVPFMVSYIGPSHSCLCAFA